MHTTLREVETAAIGVARFDVRVLLTGDRGVGKQTLARLIHAHSRGAAAPFLALDCSGVSDAAFASEWHARDGWLQRARGGTIFIERLETMTTSKQTALFRLIDGCHAADGAVRLIAAGAGDLFEAVQTGTFRGDLFYRLNTIHLHVRPLRERRQEIPMLLERFLGETSQTLGRSLPRVTAEALRRLTLYSWPGNVGELKAVADKFMLDGRANLLDSRMLPPRILLETFGVGVRSGLGAMTCRAFGRPQGRDAARFS